LNVGTIGKVVKRQDEQYLHIVYILYVDTILLIKRSLENIKNII